MEDPRTVWLSEHFRLSDFLGNHSVYSKGFANPFTSTRLTLDNAIALCDNALEPMLERFGPLSIAYGYISPDFSRKTVRYQDPETPSHHRWDLGAAADVICHKWVQGIPHEPEVSQLFADDDTSTSPALLAHSLDSSLRIPYSRLITYSESPCICVAVSSREVTQNKPRKAFYENRYAGEHRAKPLYLQQATPAARARTIDQLQTEGLPAPWRGQGFPSYHGGGLQQYQHMRVGKYTTVLDWLFSLKSISDGHKNIPSLTSDAVQDAFAAAGLVFDYILDKTPLRRISVARGYIGRAHPSYRPHTDWTKGLINIELMGPASYGVEGLFDTILTCLPQEIDATPTALGVTLSIDVEWVLDHLPSV